MSTREKLDGALKDALRAHDDLRKRVVRMALANIKQAEIDKSAPVDEAGVVAILQKEVKSRQEALVEAQRANRPDLEQEAKAEIGVLESFLPEQLSMDELEAMARQAIAETGASSQREMGLVMKAIMPRIQGRATGDQVSQTVRRLLS